MLQMRICAKGHVQIAHAKRKVLGKLVDGIGVDGGEAVNGRIRGVIGSFGGVEGLGEMSEDGCEAIIFV
jgi:hypothetical protein